MKNFHYRPQLVIQAGIRIFPYLITILFNLSQYFYYSYDYFSALNNEFEARDPNAYFERILNSPQIVHTILTLI